MLTAYAQATRNLPPTIRPTGEVRGYPWPILGTAVDTRIRMWFGEAEHPGTAQGVRILRLTQTFGAHVPDAAEAGQRLLERLKLHSTHHRPLTDTEEDTAARYAILAARYEAIYRSPTPEQGRRSMRYFTDRPPYQGQEHPLTVLARDIHAAWVTDVRAQLDAARKALAPLCVAEVFCAPTFTGSPDVGTAEADWIAGGTLIDCKASITPSTNPTVTRRWLHQIAAYLLLDYHDEWKINSVGVYLSRQGSLLVWPVRDFLTLMGARMPLEALRSALKATLTTKDRT